VWAEANWTVYRRAPPRLFKQILQLCEKAGLVKLGHVALDGTKIKANASKHKAMSYERMEKRATELEAEVAMWFGAAEAADAEEDKLHGRDQTARRCRIGSPTRSDVPRRSVTPRPSWRRRRRRSNYQELKGAIEAVCELNHDLLRPERAASKSRRRPHD
jgi:hypothetical protein